MGNAKPVADAQIPLRIEAVSKRYGKIMALEAVSLDVQECTCFGLLGPNGAGKSTLIRSIVGRVRPDSGAITIFGQPQNSAKAKSAIGWVPQDLALYPRLTCR